MRRVDYDSLNAESWSPPLSHFLANLFNHFGNFFVTPEPELLSSWSTALRARRAPALADGDESTSRGCAAFYFWDVWKFDQICSISRSYGLPFALGHWETDRNKVNTYTKYPQFLNFYPWNYAYKPKSGTFPPVFKYWWESGTDRAIRQFGCPKSSRFLK